MRMGPGGAVRTASDHIVRLGLGGKKGGVFSLGDYFRMDAYQDGLLRSRGGSHGQPLQGHKVDREAASE